MITLFRARSCRCSSLSTIFIEGKARDAHHAILLNKANESFDFSRQLGSVMRMTCGILVTDEID